MKNRNIIIFIMGVLMFSLVGNAQIVKAEIRATGLTCSMCSNAINKQLKSIAEVTNVETDLNTNTFIVTLNEQNQLSPRIFKEKVEKAGFFIGLLTITTKSGTIANPSYIVVNGKPNDTAPQVEFQVLDKGYVTEKEYKKMTKLLKEVATYAANNEDDFHIKISN
ncbi:MAG: heavy-metal-associated domain-containing protein [Limnohabitans sp.]|nr:heavy-metal-associated domain-containing protein [Limnohabitans sp.]